jgi:glucosyl-3-phosphoglycerate synthase
MAFGILQTFLSRMNSLGQIKELPEMSTVLRQFQAKEKEFKSVEKKIIEEERPPMNTIKEYREKRNIT